MMQLTIRLFGGLTIEQDEQPIPKLISRKADVLLAYLAQEPRLHGRELLATLLWDDRPQKQALSNLRTIISSLRKQVNPFVTITRKALEIQPEVWVDTAVFQQQLSAAAEHWPSPTAVTQIEEALALYVGDFLDGVLVSDSIELENWIQFNREQLRQQAIEARQNLITYYEQQRNYSDGIHHAAILLEMDPWNEEAHRQMMQLLARSGQRQAALAQYETCVRLLDEELGIPPEPETTDLYERLQTAVTTQTSNLPAIATSFVGRERELSLCLEQLRDPDCRLLTIVGLGGMGKTRLALQVAATLQTDFLNGVFFVPLAAVGSADGVTTAVAEAMPVSFHDKADTETQLLNYLRGKESLLILDNFEHLTTAAGFLNKILRQAPTVKLLVTSRLQLSLKTEWLLELDGLPYPEGTTAVAQPEQYAAIQLFEQRAQVIAPGFTLSEENWHSVNRICQIVHGLPLGIELASAWIRFLPLAELVQQIEQNLDLLTTTMRDVPERQRSLTAVFDYVWSLLNEEEQQVFAQLSVFRGSFDIDAFRTIMSGSPWTLAALVEKSLLHKEANGRYSLIEALRLYATTKLTALPDRQTQTQTQHSQYYANLLHQQEVQLNSRTAQTALNLIQQNLDNIHAAWTYAVTTHCWADLALAQESLVLYYTYRGPYQEGAALLETAVDQLAPHQQETGEAGRALAQLHNNCARLSEVIGDYATAIRQAQTAISLAQASEQKELEASAHIVWGTVLLHQADYTSADEHLTTAYNLAEDLGAKQTMATALNRLGQTAYFQSAYEEALQYQEQSLALHKEIGHQQGVSKNLINLGRIAAIQGAYTNARHHYKQALAIEEESGHRRGVAHILTNLGLVADVQSAYTDARRYHERALIIQQEIGDRQGIANSYNNLGLTANHQGDYANARHYYERALLVFEELGIRHSAAMTLNNLGIVAYAIDTETDSRHYYEAQHYYEQALSIQEEIGDRRGAALTIMNLGRITESRGQFTAMQRYSNKALTIFNEIGDRRGMILCLNNLGFVAYNQGMYVEASRYYEQVLIDADEIGDRLLRMYSFLNLANISFCQGVYADARHYNEQALARAEEIGNQNLALSYALTNMAMALKESEQFEPSLSTAQEAIRLRQAMGRKKLLMESQVALAEIWLAQNKLVEAQKEIEPIVAHLSRGGNFEGTEYRLRNRFICFQILQTLEDPRAEKIIQTAYERLQTQAGHIEDPERRHAFLYNVPWHKDIITACEQATLK